MSSFRNRLETRIANLFGYSDAVLFGRARSGVAALLDVLDMSKDSSFIMPANICPSLLLAVHSCGARVSLADVSESNGLASDVALVEAMMQAKRPGVVMPTHLYGFVQSYPQTVAQARAHGWFVLENDTIATKARSDGAEHAAFGDALLVSFGYAKAIEAGGGGALLTDDIALARELRSREHGFPMLDDAALKAEEEFMLLGRRLRNNQLLEIGPTGHEVEKLLFERVPGCQYRFPEKLEAPLSVALKGFPDVVEHRCRQVEMWNRFLAPFDDDLLVPQADCVVPWRLIRRVPGIRDKIVAALRNDGINAGTNFPPLTSSFPALFAGKRYEGAEQWGREVLNLWVTPAYNTERMKRATGIIGDILSQQGEIRQ